MIEYFYSLPVAIRISLAIYFGCGISYLHLNMKKQRQGWEDLNLIEILFTYASFATLWPIIMVFVYQKRKN